MKIQLPTIVYEYIVLRGLEILFRGGNSDAVKKDVENELNEFSEVILTSPLLKNVNYSNNIPTLDSTMKEIYDRYANLIIYGRYHEGELLTELLTIKTTEQKEFKVKVINDDKGLVILIDEEGDLLFSYNLYLSKFLLNSKIPYGLKLFEDKDLYII